MRPEPGQVLHFSEDPTISRFVPHVAATAQQAEPYVGRWMRSARRTTGSAAVPADDGLDDSRDHGR